MARKYQQYKCFDLSYRSTDKIQELSNFTKDKKNENVQLPNGKFARRSFTDNSELFGHKKHNKIWSSLLKN